MVIILFDTKAKQKLYPLTQTKAIADLRFGVFSIKERWEAISGLPVFIHTEEYLTGLYEPIIQDEYLYIDASLKDDDTLRSQILSLQTGEALHDDEGLIAGRTLHNINDFSLDTKDNFIKNISLPVAATRIQFPWQLFLWNDDQIRKDFLLLFARSTTKKLPGSNRIFNPENIIIQEGAYAEYCIINASSGPVIIGKNATLMEGSILRGPVAIGENAVIKMGSKIYGATTIGPYCTAGGEIKNSILQSFSNKAHDGYLGDSVVGSWCNLGAGTSNSNVKNSAKEISVWHQSSGTNINAGKKCGMIMGDYTRTAINTSINSGTIIGICCNIFGAGLSPKVIPDFSWGINEKGNYSFEKAIEHIKNWKEMKGRKISTTEISMLKYIFELKQTGSS